MDINCCIYKKLHDLLSLKNIIIHSAKVYQKCMYNKLQVDKDNKLLVLIGTVLMNTNKARNQVSVQELK